jgi:hypothetical protein
MVLLFLPTGCPQQAEADRFEVEVLKGGVIALPGANDLLDQVGLAYSTFSTLHHIPIVQIRAGSTSDHPGWTIVTSGMFHCSPAIFSFIEVFFYSPAATNVYAPQALSQAGIQISPFTPITTANDVTAGKPHPAPFLAGAKSLNVDPTKCASRRLHLGFNFNLYMEKGLVVEDAVNGIMSGKASGARTLATATTTPLQALVSAQPDWIVPDLTQ